MQEDERDQLNHDLSLFDRIAAIVVLVFGTDCQRALASLIPSGAKDEQDQVNYDLSVFDRIVAIAVLFFCTHVRRALASLIPTGAGR